jgi:putative transposase
MMFPLVADLAAEGVSVKLTCGVLGFSPQAFYKWRAKPCSDRDLDDAHLTNTLIDLHGDDPEFGYRFLADGLETAGHDLGERRVWRLCRDQRLWSTTTRKGRRGKGRPGPAVHDDLVQRDFTAQRPDQVWLTDITEHPTSEGKLYCCAIKDVFSNRIVGYSIADRMTSQLATSALRSAIARRQPAGTVVVHSDRGSQGGFNWSSQHLVVEVFSGSSTASSRPSDSSEAEIAWSPEVPAARRGGVLGTDRQGPSPRGGSGRGRRRAGGRCALVPQRWRHASVRHQQATVGPLPLFR